MVSHDVRIFGACVDVDRPFKIKEYFRFPANDLSDNVLSENMPPFPNKIK